MSHQRVWGGEAKRVPYAVFSGKIQWEFRRATRRMRIICQLGFSAFRESRKGDACCIYILDDAGAANTQRLL